MIAIDTPHHVTFRALVDHPKYACIGTCKKVFWGGDDIENEEFCPLCSSHLTRAVNNIHFKIIKVHEGGLTKSDVQAYRHWEMVDYNIIRQYFGLAPLHLHFSVVKPKHQKKAKKKWFTGPLSIQTEVVIPDNS